MDIITSHQDLGCEILLKLTLDDLLQLGLVSRKFLTIRKHYKYDRVWRMKLFDRWLYSCSGKFVFKQYLSQFKDVVVETPKNKFWNQTKFVLPKIKWECYRDFVLLGQFKFDCKYAILNSSFRLLEQGETLENVSPTVVDYLEKDLPKVMSSKFGRAEPYLIFDYSDGGYSDALKFWQKQYQIMRAIHFQIPGSQLIARNNFKDGMVGPIIQKTINETCSMQMGIEDRFCTTDTNIFDIEIWRTPLEQELILNDGFVHTIDELKELCKWFDKGNLEQCFRTMYRYVYRGQLVPEDILEKFVKNAMIDSTDSRELEWECKTDAEKEKAKQDYHQNLIIARKFIG